MASPQRWRCSLGVMESLVLSHKRSLMDRIAIAEIVRRTPEKELKHIHDRFDEIDIDGSGDVTLAELSRAFESLSWRDAQAVRKQLGTSTGDAGLSAMEQLHALMASVDIDGDGAMSRDE